MSLHLSQGGDIEVYPVGFGDGAELEELLAMTKLPTDDLRVKNYLRPQPHNEQKDYLISACFFKGHATLVVRDSDPNPEGVPPLKFPKIAVKERGFLEPKDRLALIHLRFPPQDELPIDTPRILELGYDCLRKRIQYDRYFEILYLRTTARVLKRIALVSCLETHRPVVSDCATFALNFVGELLDYLLNEEEITMADCERVKMEARENIHVMNGLVGESEAESRNQVVHSDEAYGSVRDGPLS
jgi:hypothetical protein